MPIAVPMPAIRKLPAIAFARPPSDPGGGVIDVNSDSVTEGQLVQVAFHKVPSGLSLNELVEVTIDLPKISSALTIPNAAPPRACDQGRMLDVWLTITAVLDESDASVATEIEQAAGRISGLVAAVRGAPGRRPAGLPGSALRAAVVEC